MLLHWLTYQHQCLYSFIESLDPLICHSVPSEIQLFTMHYEINPLHSNISMHILHTALHIFSKALTKRICLPIKIFFRF